MKTRREIIQTILLAIGGVILLAGILAGEQGRGMRGMRGMGGADHRDDMVVIHDLFANHKSIKREVRTLDDGVETVTESDDPEVTARIIEHAYAMKARMEKNQPIRMWDPIFAEIFANASKIKVEITTTAHGVRVRETSGDAYVVKLIKAHAEAVSKFVSKGMSAMHDRHEIP